MNNNSIQLSAKTDRTHVGECDRSLILIGPGEHFGLEIAERFHREGMKIGFLTKSLESEEFFSRKLTALGIESICLSADIVDVDKYKAALEAIADQLGSVSCVIYNPKASISATGLSITPDELNSSMAVNVTGALIAIQTLVPYLETNCDPCVILTGGAYKDRPHTGKFALSIGKAALHVLLRSLRPLLISRGIGLKTVVIDGAVRPTRNDHLSSKNLSDFYWKIYSSNRNNSVYKYPSRVEKDRSESELQLRLNV